MSHSYVVRAVTISRDGKWVVTGSDDKTACVWDAATGKQIRSLEGHAHEVAGVALTADGTQVLTADGNTVHLWDAATGEERRRLQQMRGIAWALAPDGTWAVTGSSDKTVRVWETATGKERRQLLGHTDWVTAVAVSADGKNVVTGSWDSTVRFWDAATGKELRRLQVPKGAVDVLALAPDGTWMVTAGEDNCARLWDIVGGKEVARLEGHTDRVIALAIAPDGKWVMTGSRDGTAAIWEASRQWQPRWLRGHAGWVNAVAIAPDGSWAATGGTDWTTRIWHVASGQELRRLQRHADWVSAVVVSPDGNRVLTASQSVAIWNAVTGKEVRQLPGFCMAMAPDGKSVATGMGDNSARIWDVATGQELRRLQGHVKTITALAFSADGAWLLTGGRDGSARIWDAATGKERRRLQGHLRSVTSVAISPDGQWVLTGSEDKTARIWSVATGTELRRLRGHTETVYAVAIAPDGKWVLTGSSDNTARIWNAATGQELRRLQGHEKGVAAVAIAPDGTWLLTGSWDHTARIWDPASGRERRRLEGHSRDLYTVAIAPDGKWALTGSIDCTTRVWNVVTGGELCRLIHSPGGTLVVTPDDYYAASKGALDAVAFRVGTHAYPFDQFDLRYNRPDLVLERLGRAPRELIDAFHQAYRIRLRRMRFTAEMLGDDLHLPQVVVAAPRNSKTNQKSLRLKITASDSKYVLDRLNILINGVPVHGVNGIGLRDKKTDRWDQALDVELSAGRNTIQVSVLNSKGAESLKESFDILCDAPAPRRRLYALAIGVSDYRDRAMRLTYADKDARDLAAFLESQTRSFADVKVKRLLNGDALKENILKAKEFLQQAQVDDQVIVFFAGHGLLDRKTFDYYFATVDVDFQDPARRGLHYDDIEGLLDGLRARKKLLLMDTCHAGEVDKEELQLAAAPRAVGEGKVTARGFRGMENVRVRRLGVANTARLLEEMFADLRRGTGTVVIAAAGGLHHALEAPQWQNGVFTYSLLQGLKGKADRNKDGRIQVSELRQYVLEEVPRLTQGRQVPTMRRENLEFDFTVD